MLIIQSISHALCSTNRYLIGHDPANWVRVDSKSGQIFLADTPDRESLHVVDNIYTVILLAVDNGKTMTAETSEQS